MLRCCWDIKMEMLSNKLEVSLAFRCQARDLDLRINSVEIRLKKWVKIRKQQIKEKIKK